MVNIGLRNGMPNMMDLNLGGVSRPKKRIMMLNLNGENLNNKS